MRPVSDRFLDALTGAHTMRAEARIVTGHQTGIDPAGVTIPIISGDVIADATAEIRSTIDLSTAPDWSVPADEQAGWPATLTDGLVTPFGPELWVRRGIEFGDRSTEWVSLGFYRIDTVAQPDAPLGQLSLTGSDRMAGIRDGLMLRPRQFPAGTSVQAAVESLVLEVYPTGEIEFDWDAANDPITRATMVERDRYAFLADLAAARGKIMYYDHRGVLVLRSRAALTNPVWEVSEGTHGVLVTLSRELSREGVYNAVVAVGEGADEVTPVQAIAFDESGSSPTRWGGPFGPVPFLYSSPLISTPAQARAAADKKLRDIIGVPFNIDFAAVPNPALEPDDPVRVKARDGSYTHLIQSLTIPLVADQPLAATTREVTIAQIGVG